VIIGPLPQVSIVVPVLHDFDAAAALLFRLPADPQVEIVLVDGDYDERLDALVCSRTDTRLVRSQSGRGHQMNIGAAHSRAPWLLFLHADSTLPAGWRQRITNLSPEICGGWFRFRLDDDAWQARVIERGVAIRVWLLRLPYGDQGIFVRREVFDRLRGYRELPLMEDVAFVRALRRYGPVAELPLALATSARRWRRDGWLRRSARNIAVLLLYAVGVSPSRLARFYHRRAVRERIDRTT